MLAYAVECPACPACKEFYNNFSFLYRRDNVLVYHMPLSATRYYRTLNVDDIRLGRLAFSPMAFYAEHDRLPTYYFSGAKVVFSNAIRKRNGWFTYHPVAWKDVMKIKKPTLYADSPIDYDFIRDYESYLKSLLSELI